VALFKKKRNRDVGRCAQQHLQQLISHWIKGQPSCRNEREQLLCYLAAIFEGLLKLRRPSNKIWERRELTVRHCQDPPVVLEIHTKSVVPRARLEEVRLEQSRNARN
jgi:hypothetical protein